MSFRQKHQSANGHLSRAAYQCHKRNVSALSDISVATTVNDGSNFPAPSNSKFVATGHTAFHRHSTAVPDYAFSVDIRIIILADSDCERLDLYEAVSALLAKQSASDKIADLHHVRGQWDVDTSELAATATVSPRVISASNPDLSCDSDSMLTTPSNDCVKSGGQSLSSAGTQDCSSNVVHFRFKLPRSRPECRDGPLYVGYRLMILSKDKHNLLKSVFTYDVLVAGVRVASDKSRPVYRNSSSAGRSSDQLHRSHSQPSTDAPDDLAGMTKSDMTPNGISLDDLIWEFEWKRLISYARKAVVPLIVLSYVRDSLPSVQHGSELLKRTWQLAESRHTIGMFANLVPDQACSAFHFLSAVAEMGHIVANPGHLLHLCVRVDNFHHFCRLVDSTTKYDDYTSVLLYPNDVDFGCACPAKDKTTAHEQKSCHPWGWFDRADNPLMVAAQLRRRDMLNHVLRLPVFTRPSAEAFLSEDTPIHQFLPRTKDVMSLYINENDPYKLRLSRVSSVANKQYDMSELNQLIHAQNTTGHTLLSMVALQGPQMEEQKLLILRKEIDLHCESSLTHEADQLKLQRCLRSQLKSSAEAAIILEQSRALQGMPKTDRELKAETCKVWTRVFFSTLFLSLIFNAIDTGSDLLIVIRYYTEWISNQGGYASLNSTTCGEDDTNILLPSPDFEPAVCNGVTAGGWEANAHLMANSSSISIQCFPQALSSRQRFGFTLSFILIPWLFFVYEFFTSHQYRQLVSQFKLLVNDLANDGAGKAASGLEQLRSILATYRQFVFCCLTFLGCLLFWPIAVLFIKYYNDCKYYLARGRQRAEREKKIEASEVLYSTARVMEVSLESSFQPTIQLYLLFPVLFRTVTASSFSLRIFTVCKNELNFPMLKTDQTISIVTSILSLAWCFTSYHATLKRGALDKDLAALFYRAVFFLSVLFQIIGRLFILVMFAYSFGPGMYFPLLIFLSAHILLMTVLHFIFSDASQYWVRGGFLNLSFFHYMIGNGLANIYIHNWIRMDPLLIQYTKPRQHVSTLVRQLVFDAVFMTENVVLLLISLNSGIKELNESTTELVILLLGFTVTGLILKAVYYRYLHLWAWLIMDYITLTIDDSWRCILISNMFLCGELRERELTLCCIPRSVRRTYRKLCQDSSDDSAASDSRCTFCTIVASVLLCPLAAVVSVVVFVIILCLAVLFAPLFVVLVLPVVLIVKFRHLHKRDQSTEENESGRSEDSVQTGQLGHADSATSINGSLMLTPLVKSVDFVENEDCSQMHLKHVDSIDDLSHADDGFVFTANAKDLQTTVPCRLSERAKSVQFDCTLQVSDADTFVVPNCQEVP